METLLLGLIISVFALINNAKGTAYHCTAGNVVAYTPTGTFQRASLQEINAPCALLIPASLFRTPQSRLQLSLTYNNTTHGSICSADYLSFARKRICGSVTNEVSHIARPSSSSAFVRIEYHTILKASRTSFFFNYIIYDELCLTTDYITTMPVIVHSTASRYRQCSVRLDVSNVDKLTINQVKDASIRCPYNDVIKMYGVLSERPICQGRQCLNQTGIDVQSAKTVEIRVSAADYCVFYWKVTAFSRSSTQDICTLTGSDLTLSKGNLASPGYPTGHSGVVNCKVVISGFDAVEIMLMYYNLKGKDCKAPSAIASCICEDKLVINGESFCGGYSRRIHRAYVGTDSEVSVQLVTTTASLLTGEGFYLKYRGYSNAINICDLPPGSVTVPLILKSPNFPESYFNNKSCMARINVSSINKIEIRFIVFTLEEKKGCPFDYLSLNTQRWCGNKSGDVLEMNLRNINELTFHFKSDHSTNAKGFYISIDMPESKVPVPTAATPLPPADKQTDFVDKQLQATVASSVRSATMSSSAVPRSSNSTSEENEQQETVIYGIATNPPAVRISSAHPNQRKIPIGSMTTPHSDTEDKLTDAVKGSADRGCAIPWYYWIGSLIAILLAVLITMTICLIKLKRLKVSMSEPHDTDSSRDGLSNPVYYNNPHFPHNNKQRTTHSNGGSPFYTNKDRIPAGKRVVINRNAVQTTV